MRVNKDSKTRSSVTAANTTTANCFQAQQTEGNQIATANNTATGPTMAQPLQARSSNSGTSVRRSDNISQSSYPAGDILSDKAFQGWSKTGSTVGF